MIISKTDFIAYLDAPRHLWAIKHNKLTSLEISAFLRHLVKQGDDVEILAEKYIHKILMPKYGISIDDVILQPTHIDGSFQARIDVLIRNPRTKKWDMYEIKSSLKIDSTHIYDITFQYLVFKEKYEIGDKYIIHLNNKYVRKGEIELDKLFEVENVNEDVDLLKDKVWELRNEALFVAQTENFTEVLNCIRPKDCPCLSICHPNLPNYSIYDINNLTGTESKIRKLEKMGVKSIYDVPNDFILSTKQRFQIEVAQSQKIYINNTKIQNELNKLNFPLYFLDYETFNPAIPLYNNYKPYQHITFQYSLHVKATPTSEYKHYEFIETNKVDPIPNLIASLRKNIGESGSIIVWYKPFETLRTKEMGELYPEFKDFCKNIVYRIYDLMNIFKKQYYLDSLTKGSCSIKQVLPTMAPDLSYKDMEIAEGATAMTSWNKMVYDKRLTEEQTNKFKNDLLKYCELDTLAMVRIYEKLYSMINDRLE
ncbi:MAG TPA: DUF2779 domain-containing protein [Candidatus Dojkabacteria bacterium]|nr:DUF2779 domain-containing protein [Candidatus Dojkabacteria bacterium]